MNSFDFYDTLFTRLVAEPRSIFELMEESLGEPGFAARRVAAETAARRAAGGAEVDLDAIYAQLGPAASSGQAMALELRLERELVAPVTANLARVADTDLVVSDMYLPGTVLKAILGDHRPASALPAVVVSNEARLRKSDGSLWRHLRAEHAALRAHVGDSLRGDVRHPRRVGLQAEHFRGAELNRYERRFVALGSLDGSAIAGLCRATRLSSPTTDAVDHQLAAIDEVFGSVIAPVLVAFVEHVLDDAAAAGIDQLYFLARDGQVLHRIANALIAARGLPLHAHYIYGSRHALHLPGLTSLDRAESWLLEDTPHLSLAEIASRGELPESLVLRVGERFGFAGFEENIARSRRADLKLIIRAPEIEAQLHANSKAKWQMALDYYRQAGLLPGARAVLVDVGWTGRMQASLRTLLDKAEGSPVTLRGHYLCLSSKLKVSESDMLMGFLHDPDASTEPCAFDPYRCVVEASLMADHGTTLGFQAGDGTVEPLLGKPPTPAARRTVARQQDAVLRFVHHMLKVERARGKRLRWPRAAVSENLRLMLRQPRERDAEAFAGRGFFEGQADNLERDIVRRVAPGLDWLRRQALGLWPEGSLSFSGGRSVLGWVRAARWLKSRALT